MRIYARLFYNNIESFLANTFRVFRKITADADWHAMVRDFVDRHRAESPYFSQIPEEFLQYLGARLLAEQDAPSNAGGQHRDAATRGRVGGTGSWPPARSTVAIPPFALELCHYEWVEMALDLAPDATCEFDDDSIAIDDALALSPLAWPLRYVYPVRRIGPDLQPVDPPAAPTWLIGWRDRHDKVAFMSSNAVTTRLLQLIAEGTSNGEAFETIATEIDAPVDRIAEKGLDILERLHRCDIVVRA